MLGIAAQIVRRRPAEAVLNGVGHALAALPSLAGAPASVSLVALFNSSSDSLRAVGALHWTMEYAPADAKEDTDNLGTELVKDQSPNVRRGLASNLAVTAAKSGLSSVGQAAADTLSGDIHWGIRRAARQALAAAAEFRTR